jgi:MoaA/NifB/PqqE/SkfB family radical SAM enzyme
MIGEIFSRILRWELKEKDLTPSLLQRAAAGTGEVLGRLLEAADGPRMEPLLRSAAAVLARMRPEESIPFDPRKKEILAGYIRSLDPERKKDLILRILRHHGLRSLRRYRRAVTAAGRDDARVELGAVTLSIGGPCNLSCDGCFTERFKTGRPAGLDRVRLVLDQAQSLDAGHVSIIGAGEPFHDPAYGRRLLRLIGRYPGIDFSLFTNGTLVDEAAADCASEAPNVLVLVSIDGQRETHEKRRGPGTYGRALEAGRLLRAKKVPVGFSVTVGARNWEEVTQPSFAEAMAAEGFLFGLYNEFFSLRRHPSRLSRQQQGNYLERFARMSAASPVYIMELRSLEETRYRCRAKKGTSCFIDAATGKVAPCFLFPYTGADCNLYASDPPRRLEAILSGPFFTAYRRGYESCGHCSRDYRGELGYVLGTPFLDPEDKKDIHKLMESMV